MVPPRDRTHHRKDDCMIKLIALDLDGTLLDPSGRITPGAKEAVARAR